MRGRKISFFCATLLLSFLLKSNFARSGKRATGRATYDRSLARKVNLLVSQQNLGHHSFHHWLRTHITEYLKGGVHTTHYSDGILFVVGVEYGAEIEEYVQKGWKIHAVEPNPAYLEALSHKCVPSNCTLTKCAAGELNSQEVTLNYQGSAFTSCMVKLQDIETGHITSLSIDVQGNELSVLKGSYGLLNAKKVDMIFSEYQPGENCESLLHFLHSSNYVLFDTLWYGQNSLSDELENVQFDWGDRTSISIHEYCKSTSFVNEFYSAPYREDGDKQRLLDQTFRWLQNDIIAVRSDLLDSDFLRFLANVSAICGQTVCESSRVIKFRR